MRLQVLKVDKLAMASPRMDKLAMDKLGTDSLVMA
jgi:hypothetical protein